MAGVQNEQQTLPSVSEMHCRLRPCPPEGKLNKPWSNLSRLMQRREAQNCNLTLQHMFLGIPPTVGEVEGGQGSGEDGGVQLSCVNNNSTLERE